MPTKPMIRRPAAPLAGDVASSTGSHGAASTAAKSLAAIAGWSSEPKPGSIASAGSPSATNAAPTSIKPSSPSDAPSSASNNSYGFVRDSKPLVPKTGSTSHPPLLTPWEWQIIQLSQWSQNRGPLQLVLFQRRRHPEGAGSSDCFVLATPNTSYLKEDSTPTKKDAPNGPQGN